MEDRILPSVDKQKINEKYLVRIFLYVKERIRSCQATLAIITGAGF